MRAPPSLSDRFQGCLIGLALGDALGAPHEGGPLERALWRLIGHTRSGHIRWTDDTQMSLDLVESLISKSSIDPDDLATRFANSYRWSRGYGPATATLLKRIQRGEPWHRANTSIYPEGSYGNGAAMRAPAVGLFYSHRPAELDHAAQQSAIVTHAHPLAIQGARLIARATAEAVHGHDTSHILSSAFQFEMLAPLTSRLKIAQSWLNTSATHSPIEVAAHLGNGISAHESCITALYIALRFCDQEFSQMQHFISQLHGDVDTIGAMSGAIWGACNGIAAISHSLILTLEQHERILMLAKQLQSSAQIGLPDPI